MSGSPEMKLEFEDIRPYFDDEVEDALQRLIVDPSFLRFVQQVVPDLDQERVTQLLGDVTTIRDFQEKLMYPLAHGVAQNTTGGITSSGTEKLEAGRGYLFISNHRDIILDSAFLNLLLFQNGMDTCEVAIGSNLLIQPWIKDLVRLNKNFIVHRNVPAKQLYEYSLKISNYIRRSIIDRHVSVWIAQREGRTKDGDDRTQPGLLKMFAISGKSSDMVENFKALNITPLAISYEYEPCDYLKAREIYIKQQTGHYKKTVQDDLKSMLQGIESYKGRVHFAVGAPLAGLLEEVELPTNKNDLIKRIAQSIDQEIYEQYHLWPTNYIAYDMLYGGEDHAEMYTSEEKAKFQHHVDKLSEAAEEPTVAIREIILKIYAAPVENKLNQKR